MLSHKQRDFLRTPLPRITIVEGCISSGKTFICNHKAIKHLVNHYTGRGLVFFIGKTIGTLEKNVLRPMQEAYRGYFDYNLSTKRASLCGIRIDLEGCNDIRAENKIRGTTAEFIYGDEITLWNKEFLVRCMGSLRTPNAVFLGTTNPDTPRHFVKTDYLDREDELGLWNPHFAMDDNPSLTAEYKRQVDKEYTGVFHDRMIKGLWVRAEGLIYPMFDRKRHTFTKPPEIREIAFSVDVGHANATVFLAFGVGVDGRAYLLKEYYHSGRDNNQTKSPMAYAKDFVAFKTGIMLAHPNARLDAAYIDPSALGFIAQLEELGEYKVYRAKHDVIPGIQTVQSVIDADMLRIHEDCTRTLDELDGYCWDERAADCGEDKPVKENDHAADAIRYYFHTTRMDWVGKRVTAVV